MQVEHDVIITMRDGARLRADVFRGDDHERRPTLLHRTPYDRKPQGAGRSLDGPRLVEAGFNLVVQDVRGRYGSEGVFEPFVHEAADGADTISWIARQRWSTPWVGMVGRSYGGVVQWLAATSPSPELRGIAPEVCSASLHEGWTYLGGALQLAFCLRWLYEDLAQPDDDIEERLRAPWTALPLIDHLAPYYRTWLEHPQFDDYWRALGARDAFIELTAPALVIGGWYDPFLTGTLRDFAAVREAPFSAEVRERSRLIVGPWMHDDRTGVFSDRDFGESARVDLTRIQSEWFLGLLQGRSSGPPVRLFVMGADRWEDFDAWPPTAARELPLYLDEAAPGSEAGALRRSAPARAGFEGFSYDPDDPVPTLGGAITTPDGEHPPACGPMDQRPLAHRRDILRYVTRPLDRPLLVVGEVTLVLFVSSSVGSTDFTAKLIDLAPDGTATLVCDGVLRVTVGRDPRRIEIAVGATAMLFRAKHRVRIDVSSSNAPRFDPNPNTGAPTLALAESKRVVADNRVHHGGPFASHMILPVLDVELP